MALRPIPSPEPVTRTTLPLNPRSIYSTARDSRGLHALASGEPSDQIDKLRQTESLQCLHRGSPRRLTICTPSLLLVALTTWGSFGDYGMVSRSAENEIDHHMPSLGSGKNAKEDSKSRIHIQYPRGDDETEEGSQKE